MRAASRCRADPPAGRDERQPPAGGPLPSRLTPTPPLPSCIPCVLAAPSAQVHRAGKTPAVQTRSDRADPRQPPDAARRPLRRRPAGRPSVTVVQTLTFVAARRVLGLTA